MVPHKEGFPTHSANTGFYTPLVANKHMIITARGAGFGPEAPQVPTSGGRVLPRASLHPGLSAAHCWGALSNPSLSHLGALSNPSLSHLVDFFKSAIFTRAIRTI